MEAFHDPSHRYPPETTARKGIQPQLMQHQVVDCRIGKPQKDFFCSALLQFLMFKQIRQQPIGVVPTDRAQDHLDGIVQKCL